MAKKGPKRIHGEGHYKHPLITCRCGWIYADPFLTDELLHEELEKHIEEALDDEKNRGN